MRLLSQLILNYQPKTKRRKSINWGSKDYSEVKKLNKDKKNCAGAGQLSLLFFNDNLKGAAYGAGRTHSFTL